MSAASSEAKSEAATDPPGELTDNEKKLRLTIDNLTKESATLTEKNEELDVSITIAFGLVDRNQAYM